MSTIQRRIALIVGAAMALLAFTAAPALAVNPDFPHEQAAADWTAVEVADWNNGKFEECSAAAGNCDFSESGPLKGAAEFLGFKQTYNEECTLKGTVLNWAGEVEVNDNSTCAVLDTGSTNAKICQHSFTEEFWIRLPLSIGGNATEIFGHLIVDPSGLATSVPSFHPRGIAFGDVDGDATTSFNYVGGSGPQRAFLGATFDQMWEEKELLMGRDEGKDPCAWPELS